MRREFQEPVASFVADVCRTLYRADNAHARKFAAPGIVVYVGDVRTNVAEVVVKPKTRADGTVYTRIYLPAPAYSDVAKLRRETVKAFYLAVKGESLDDAAAEKALRTADPALRIADEYAAIANWLDGGPSVDQIDVRYVARLLFEMAVILDINAAARRHAGDVGRRIRVPVLHSQNDFGKVHVVLRSVVTACRVRLRLTPFIISYCPPIVNKRKTQQRRPLRLFRDGRTARTFILYYV